MLHVQSGTVSSQARTPSALPASGGGLLGRCFLHPVFDYLLIGGGLSLMMIPVVYWLTGGAAMFDFQMLPWLILCSNSAHFAASTVRLYTKPGSRDALPFLTMIFPLMTLCVLTLVMMDADRVGRYVFLLYLAWSPFHYAAQAYGIAVVYCVRSGCQLTQFQKRVLWWIAVLPFFKVLLSASSRHVANWVMPESLLWSELDWRLGLTWLADGLGILAVGLPFVFFAQLWLGSRQRMPVISLMAILTNAVWFTLFPLIDGFVWTTIFHGVQYLAIVMIFHVKDRVARAENHRGPLYHAFWFYGVSLVLGYALFNCLPFGYQLLGFGAAESVLLVIAAINIHHFIVDAYIWKLGRGDANRRVVESQPVSPAEASIR